MQIYTHARNVRFLPQLEALEESRRKERTAELGKALGVPPRLIEAYLEHRRATDDTASDEAGNEILYEGEAIEKLSAVAARLGTSDSERMRTLVEIQKKAAQRADGVKRAPTEAGPTKPLPAKSARKRPVASTGATGRQRSSAKTANKAR